MVFSPIIKWLRLRYIQYQVTMPLLMLSPIEQAVFNLFVLLIFGMVFVAAYLYLPDHVATVLRRATFYFFGNENAVSKAAGYEQVAEAVTETLRTKAEL